MQSAFNQFLLDLYSLVRAEPSQNFSAAALELLKRALPFDSGLWATFTHTPRGPVDHWRYLHGFPDQMLQEYQAVKQ